MLKPIEKKRKTAFIPYLVVGDPSLEFSEKVIDALIEEGADLIELGVPYSDALADGPVIQSASERAAKSISLEDVLKFAARTRIKHPVIPLILFTYFNPILKMGLERFADRASASGITAVLVVDLPPEEAKLFCPVLAAKKLKTVFLASPTTPPARLAKIAEATTGFLYYVSRTGVTGEQQTLSASLASEIEAIRQVTDIPLAVGFGISNSKQAKTVSELADAVVVGSAFVKLISGNSDETHRLKAIRELARSISAEIA